MPVEQLDNFFNEGFGWTCRQCHQELSAGSSTGALGLSRTFREGEAESKNPTMAGATLARWTDKTRRFLTCPRCSITEPVEKN